MHETRFSRRRAIALATSSMLTGLFASGCTWLDARSNERVTVNILAQDRLDPSVLTISPGTTVVWQNLSSRRHAVTTDAGLVDNGAGIVVPEGGAPWDSGDLTTGMTWEHTFHAPGTWVYIDRYAGERMSGVIVVNPD